MSAGDAPRTIGRYQIDRLLGKGAVGQVYLAKDPLLDRFVAIKVLTVMAGLPPEELAEVRARFAREAKAAAALSHPSIVTIHDVGEHEGIPFIAMEYLRGVTLDRHTRREHLLPPPRVMEVGRQAALALAEAHDAGIVHRDIKPANLVLLEDGTVKVADFGLAKDPRTSLTSDHSLLGTPNYMSPEQIAGRPLDGRSDLWSLAVSLFELLTGERPFGGESISSVLYRIVNDPPRPLAEIDAALPNELQEFFDHALAKDPAARFESGRDVATTLDEVRARITGTATGSPRPIAPPPRTAVRQTPPATQRATPPPEVSERPSAPDEPGRSKSWLIVPVLLLVLGAAAFGVWKSGLLDRTPPARELSASTKPPNLRLVVKRGNAQIDPTGKVVIPSDAVGPVVVAIDDRCFEGEAEVPANSTSPVVVTGTPIHVTVPVASEPVSASVTVDGAPVDGKTPLVVTLARCADHTIGVSVAGYNAAKLPLAQSEDPERWKAALGAITLIAAEVPTGQLKVPAAPGYAVSAQVGGKAVKAGSVTTVSAGRHQVTLESREIVWRETFSTEVTAGGTVTLAVRYPATGTLTINAVPAGGSVSVKGNGSGPIGIGETNLQGYRLAVGSYSVTVSNPNDGTKATKTVQIAPDQAVTLRVGQKDWQ